MKIENFKLKIHSLLRITCIVAVFFFVLTNTAKLSAATSKYQITGTAFLDQNANGFQEKTDNAFTQGSLTISGNGTTPVTTPLTNNGTYSFSVPKSGLYTISIKLFPGYHLTNSPVTKTLLLTDAFPKTTANFGVSNTKISSQFFSQSTFSCSQYSDSPLNCNNQIDGTDGQCYAVRTGSDTFTCTYVSANDTIPQPCGLLSSGGGSVWCAPGQTCNNNTCSGGTTTGSACTTDTCSGRSDGNSSCATNDNGGIFCCPSGNTYVCNNGCYPNKAASPCGGGTGATCTQYSYADCINPANTDGCFWNQSTQNCTQNTTIPDGQNCWKTSNCVNAANGVTCQDAHDGTFKCLPSTNANNCTTITNYNACITTAGCFYSNATNPTCTQKTNLNLGDYCWNDGNCNNGQYKCLPKGDGSGNTCQNQTTQCSGSTPISCFVTPSNFQQGGQGHVVCSAVACFGLNAPCASNQDCYGGFVCGSNNTCQSATTGTCSGSNCAPCGASNCGVGNTAGVCEVSNQNTCVPSNHGSTGQDCYYDSQCTSKNCVPNSGTQHNAGPGKCQNTNVSATPTLPPGNGTCSGSSCACDQNSCGAGKTSGGGCMWDTTRNTCTASTGGGKSGDTCFYSTQCQTGLSCIFPQNNNQTGTCQTTSGVTTSPTPSTGVTTQPTGNPTNTTTATTTTVPTSPTGLPYCDTGTCNTCQASVNTCGTNNGTQTCSYATLSSGGQCTPRTLNAVQCTLNTCSANLTCQNNTCVATTGTPGASPTVPVTPFLVTVGLDGLGSAGDTKNQNSTASNKNPVNTKLAYLTLTDASANYYNGFGILTYNTITGKYSGTVNIPVLPNGIYSVRIFITKYLQKLLTTGLTVQNNSPVTLPSANLVAGDINGDNQLSILDYNILISCSIFSQDNGKACNSQQQIADLNEDGAVDQLDYNLFLREFTSVRNGD